MIIMKKEIEETRYNNKFPLDTLEEDNYVYLRCKGNFSKLYTHILTHELYKELVTHVRVNKNRIHVREANDFLEYIYFSYNDITYHVKFNMIDEMIKSFWYLEGSFCRRYKLKRNNYKFGRDCDTNKQK